MHYKVILGNHIRKPHDVSCFLSVLFRANRNAGADCLYVPGIADAESIGRLAKAAEAPVNVVMGLAGNPLSVPQPENLAVKRVSIGGSLALP